MSVLGYTDRPSYRPGETVLLHVGADAPAEADAQVVRFLDGSPEPGSAPVPAEPVAGAALSFVARPQTSAIGSRGVIPLEPPLPAGAGLAMRFWFQAWPSPQPGEELLAGLWEAAGGEPALAVALLPDRRLALVAADGRRARTVEPVRERLWYGLALDAGATVRLALSCLGGAGAASLHDEILDLPAGTAPGPLRRIGLAGGEDDPSRCFNGRLARPSLSSGAAGDPAGWLDPAAPLPGRAVGAWDFAADAAGETIRNRVAGGPEGRLLNLPMRRLPGPFWSPLDGADGPEAAEAVHFHADDVGDLGWPAEAGLRLPETMRGGVYAVRLSSGGSRQHLTFTVADPRAEVAFLLPTLTYLAYANHRMFAGHGEGMSFAIAHEVKPAPLETLVLSYPELGRSIYDVHEDGSGVAHASRRRPIVNLEPEQADWLGAGPHHLAADLYVAGLLERMGTPWSALADEDLHERGVDALGKARVLVTGCHPEYWTAAMMRALDAFMARGGKLVYLGANGFYWVTSLNDGGWALEVRRSHAGSRAWSSEGGEDIHAFDGARGGLWRNRGRPPQAFAGVGMAAQGWGGSVGYRRLPASADPRVAPFFEGLPADAPFGLSGFMMGGAVGYEVDRADRGLGTPADALVLATSDGLTDHYQLTAEEITNTTPFLGGSQHPDVRADMVWFPTRWGGEVFATGSIAWASAIGWNGGDNEVDRITRNVIRTFLAR